MEEKLCGGVMWENRGQIVYWFDAKKVRFYIVCGGVMW